MAGVLPRRGGGAGDIQQQIIDAYKSIRSFTGISKPSGTIRFNVPSDGNSQPPYTITHLNVATQSGEIRGSGFTANSDGTITANKDMFAVIVNINMIARFSSSDNVVVGIGIGDPNSIPNLPGAQVLENYVSRFRCARVGDGSGNEVTWDLYVSPVGKSTTDIQVNGVKTGDKIFPVIWTQESDSAQLSIEELIFTVEEISI